MSQAAKIRPQRVPASKYVFGLLLVAWLNMALQPCAMALGETSKQDCQNCPPALTTENASPGAHETYDTVADMSSCESRVSQCAFGDEVNYESRSVKVKDTPDNTPVGPVPYIAVNTALTTLPGLPDVDDPSHLSGGPQALNVLYCVYLI